MNASLGALRTAASEALSRGDHEAAIGLLTDLSGHDPSSAVLQNIGVSHYRLGDHEKALSVLREALERDPGNAGIVSNIAVISSEIGPPEFRDKTALGPRVWNEVGLNLYFHGDFDGARDALERAIALDPEYFAAYHNICDMIPVEESATWVAKANALSPQSNEDIAAIQYMLAYLHDLRKEYEPAAKAMLKGGAHRRLTFDPPFNPAGHDGLVNSFIATFDEKKIAEIRAREGGAGLIFVISMPRSGSTLTSRLLAGDPRVADLGEQRAFPMALIAELERLGGGQRAPLSEIGADSVARIAESYLARLPDGGEIRLDKYPENAMFLGLVHAAFPDAKIVETRRDPYDTMLSCLSKNFSMGNSWSYRPEDIRAYYDAYLRVMDHWRGVLPETALLLSDYDDLTTDTDASIERLSAHCGVRAAKAPGEGAAVVKTASAMQARGEIKRRDRSRYAGYRPFISF